MNFKEWLKDFLTNRTSEPLKIDCNFSEFVYEYVYKMVALQSAINLIAKSTANSEFKTYEKNKEVKKDSYYLFNIEPNLNQNASEFWIKAISKLIEDNEVLIVQINKYFYVADTYVEEKRTISKSVFTDIVVDNLNITKTFSSGDVFFTRLNNKNIQQYVESMLTSYEKAVQIALETYKKQNGIKGILEIDTMSPQFKNAENNPDAKKIQDWIKDMFKPYFENVNAVLLLEKGQKWTENKSSIEAPISMDEVKKGIDGAFELVARCLNIPKGILMGDLAEVKEQMKNFLTFCVDPISEMFEREINRKYYGIKDYLEGNYLKIDTSRVEHINIFDVAGSLDVLTRISWSRNDLNKILDEPEIDEEWANRHYVTKNYMDLKGENNEK